MGRLILGEGFEVTITTTGSKMVVQDQDGGKLAISSSTMIFDSGSATETKMINDGNRGIKFFPKGAVFPTVISGSGIIFEKGSSKEKAMEARADGIRIIKNDGTKLFKMKDDGTTETKGATSQSIVNFEGALSASGYVKCKNFFMGHNYGFAPYGIIAHADIVPSEAISMDAATKFALGFHPNATNTMLNVGPNGCLSFMEGGSVHIKMDHEGGLQIGGPGSTSVATSKALKAGHKLEVEGHITSSGKLIVGATTQSSAEVTIEGDISASGMVINKIWDINDGDQRPDVSSGSFFRFVNSTSTEILALRNGKVGQVVTMMCSGSNCEFDDGDFFKNHMGSTQEIGMGDTIQLICEDIVGTTGSRFWQINQISNNS